MKRMIIFCVCWILAAQAFAGGTNMPGAAPTLEKSAENGLQRAIRAVCSVTAYDADGRAFSTGSAVIMATNAVLTCHHVVAGAAIVILQTYDGEKLRVLSYNPIYRSFSDLIILKIDGTHIPPPILSNKDRTSAWDNVISYQVGDHVYAIGNPQGLSGTVSDGIISAMRFNKNYGVGDIIQTTAPISQGSSGGALVNTDGQLLGLVVWQMKEGQNLNFAFSVLEIADIVGGIAKKGDRYPLNTNKVGWWTLPVPISVK